MPTTKTIAGIGMICGTLLICLVMIPLIPRAHAIDCSTITCSGAPSGNPAVCPTCCQDCNNECISTKNLCILEPLPGGPSYLNPTTAPFQNFKDYVNNGLWQFMFTMGVAIAVLNGVIGGLQIVFSNGDSGAIDKGKHRLMWSALGLILLIMAGVVMEFINPVAFKNA